MSWGNQINTTTTVITTTSTTQRLHEGSLENDFQNFQISYGGDAGKSPEYRADAKIQKLANAVCESLCWSPGKHDLRMNLSWVFYLFSCEKTWKLCKVHLRNTLLNHTDLRQIKPTTSK